MSGSEKFTFHSSDIIRQWLVLLASPLIWIASSLGLIFDSARSPGEFSDLSANLLVPQTFAFSIWFPIFIGILAYGVVQARKMNRARPIFRVTGWWMAAGLWGVVAWGVVTALLPEQYVEWVASLIFIPSMVALVIGMVKMTRRRTKLDGWEIWLVLIPVSLIAGWCSIAVFVGLNGLVWSWVETLGWSQIGTALSVLAIALGWVIIVLRRGVANRIYAVPIVWGLGFLAVRHFSPDGEGFFGVAAIVGIFAVIIASTFKVSRDAKAVI